MNYYLAVLKKYAVFSGRSQRAEYWYFALFNIIILTVSTSISAMVSNNSNTLGTFSAWFIVQNLYGIAIFIPALALTVRRLHDVGKSGWMLLITFIPLIGAIWFFVLMVTDSNPGENKYGPNPKRITTT